MSNDSCLLFEQDGINQGPRQQRRALGLDPRILFALWLYAGLYEVGGGCEVARLARELDAYRWICGGVSVNNHALNDFRSGNYALMDEVLAANVAALATAGAISLEGRGASRHASASRRGGGVVPAPGQPAAAPGRSGVAAQEHQAARQGRSGCGQPSGVGRARQYSIRIYDQWRVRFVWKSDGAHQVEIVDNPRN